MPSTKVKTRRTRDAIDISVNEQGALAQIFSSSEFSTCSPKASEESGLADGAIACALLWPWSGVFFVDAHGVRVLGHRTGIDEVVRESNSAEEVY